MAKKQSPAEVPLKQLRWRLDPSTLPFESTKDLKPLKEIIGQDRAVEAFKFGMGIRKRGYNIFVTGYSGTGRLSTVKRLLRETSRKGGTPDDLCYANNFKDPESPILIRMTAGKGIKFKKDMDGFLETLKEELPQLFESRDYIDTKKEIMEAYENKGKSFFKKLEEKVREQDFALVDIQTGQIKRPDVMPLIDGEPVNIDQVEDMVEKGNFPKDKFEAMKKQYARLKKEIEQVFLKLRDMQKELHEKLHDMDKSLFMKTASELADPLKKKYNKKPIAEHLDEVINDLSENLQIFAPQEKQQIPGVTVPVHESDQFQPYRINLFVDNSDQKGPPVIMEQHPTYRNLFGSIERVVDRSGIWRTDFTKIKAGSLIKADGGYLIINLMDAVVEPGVWQTLKRTLRNERLEIQAYDPFYLFTTSSLKPEPIDINVKVVVVSNPYLYHMLSHYDEDVKKIFKVRADFTDSMERNDESVIRFAEFIRMRTKKNKTRPFDRKAVAALFEEAVRMTGRKEKVSISFPQIADLINEADFRAGEENVKTVSDKHVDRTLESRIYRSNLAQERMQEMINRGTLMIDTEGTAVGQINGLALYSLGDFIFAKPTRITASTSMGRAGIINIERESDLSGNTHNKGVLILAGYLRKKYAQDKPLSMSASIAFEQSYGGVDGDSASSSEIYALLSSLSEVPAKQYIAVTGSVNQNGEVQAIGGVNHKIEGFFDCCRAKGLNSKQGVMIPESNIPDLMLRKDVVDSIKKGTFHLYSVKTIDEGLEILLDKKAGKKKTDGTFTKNSINDLVDRTLIKLAEGLKNFGNQNAAPKKPKSATKKAGRGKKGDR